MFEYREGWWERVQGGIECVFDVGGAGGINGMPGWWGKYVLPTVQVIVIQTVIYLALAVLRICVHFSEITNQTIIKFVEVWCSGSQTFIP